MHIFTCISGSQSILQSEPARASALELAQVPGVWILLWRADAIALRRPALKSSGSHSPCWPCARTCERGREGFLQRGDRHCGPASTAAWLPFPEVPPSQAHSRTHLPLLVLVRWLAGSRAPAPCRVALALCTWGSRSADASERVRATPARGQLLRGLGEVCPEQVMFLGNWMVWGSQLRYERSSPRLTGRA